MKKIKVLLCCMLMAAYVFPAVTVSSAGSDSDVKKEAPQVPKVTGKVKIDGVLDEEVWQQALKMELKYEVDPGENIEPPVKTEVLLAYGSDRLFAAFRAYDTEPGKIRARFQDRDHIENDDHVGILLDTFNDSRRSFNFYCNPYGIQADRIQVLMVVGGEEWDAIWNSAGRITEDGYTVEISIPFTSLSFQGKKGGEGQVWGIDAIRSYPRKVTHLIGLFPRDRSNNCYQCQMTKVSGFAGAKPGRNIELDPTLSAILTQEREEFPAGKFVRKTGEVDPGLSMQWDISPNLTFSGAVNPDFSQVEADAAQLDINTQFALYYPEKRPFFLEDHSLFFTNFYVVHTRSIVDPDWGVKLTGKQGRHAFGFFSVQDSITNLVFPSSQSSDSVTLNMNSISSAARYRMDIGKSSNVGLLVTDREGDDYFNRVASFDADFRFTKKDRLIFQYVGSQTQYPDQIAADYNQPLGDFGGTALTFLFQHATEHYMLFTRHQNVSGKFRSDLGFMPQSDFVFWRFGGQYFWRKPPGHWYTFIRIGARYDTESDHANILNYKTMETWIRYFGPKQSFIDLTMNIGKRGFMGVEFDNTYLTVDTGFRPVGSLLMRMFGIYGDQVDFDNVRQGKRMMLNPILQYNLGRQLYFGIDHIYEQLDVEGERLYTANLSNLRFVYQFNRRAFLRTLFQYAHFDYNTALYTFPIDPKFKEFFSQVLFSYKVNPQTVLFLGYSDNHYGYQLIPMTQNNRTFFFKIGYALRL